MKPWLLVITLLSSTLVGPTFATAAPEPEKPSEQGSDGIATEDVDDESPFLKDEDGALYTRNEEERANCSFERPDGGEVNATVATVEITTYGARCSDSTQTVEIRVGGTVVVRIEGDIDGAACVGEAIELVRSGALVRFVPKGESVVLDPATDRDLEQGWAGELDANFAALAVLLGGEGRSDLEGAAWILAARKAVRLGDFQEAVRNLESARATRLDPKWSKRRSVVARELDRAHDSSMPLRFGAPRRLGSLPFTPETPLDRRGRAYVLPESRSGLFWQGRLLCVEQEREASRTMRCFDTERGKWGAKVPFRIEGGIEGWVLEGSCSDGGCTSTDYCWHSGFPPFDAFECPPFLEGCDEIVDAFDCPPFLVDCDEVVGVVEGPRLVLQDKRGLTTIDATGARKPLPDGIRPDRLHGLNGTALAGGNLYFSGAVLRDATRPERTWLPLHGKLSNVEVILMSPDLRWAAVITSTPGELWMVFARTGVSKGAGAESERSSSPDARPN